MERWSSEAVDKLGGDDQVRKAGRKLASPTPWSEVGITGALLFGRCRGSGKKPYDVSVDLSGPRYKCSCPSLKFPCKHCMGLMYLWADGHVDEQGMAADFASEWEAKNAERQTQREAKKSAPRTQEQEEAAARRAVQREEKVDAGVADLQLFLRDLVSQGLASNSNLLPTRLREQAARLVDAQAPGLARRVGQLAQISDANPRWTELFTEELGRVHLLARSWANRAALPEALAHTVRHHIGFTSRTEEIQALPGITDTWAVVGLRDAEEDRLTVRRVWLWGTTTGTPALVLFFAAAGSSLEAPLVAGTMFDGTLHFHPGQPQLRAVLGTDLGAPRAVSGWKPQGNPVTVLRQQWRDALAADPWTTEIPVIMSARLTAAPEATSRHAALGLLDADGETLALRGEATWRLAMVMQDRATVVMGELNREGLLPSAVMLDDEVVFL